MPQSLDTETQGIIVKVMIASVTVLGTICLAAQMVVLPKLRKLTGEVRWQGPSLVLGSIKTVLSMLLLTALVTLPIVYFGDGIASSNDSGVTNSSDGSLNSSINFCEDDFTDTIWIAEPSNTVSSLLAYCPLALLGLFGPPSKEWNGRSSGNGRVAVIYITLLVIGIGSTLLHALLTAEAQSGDELPMLWFVAVAAFMTLDIFMRRRRKTSNALPTKEKGTYVLQLLMAASAGMATGVYCFNRENFLPFYLMFVAYAWITTFSLSPILFFMKWDDTRGERANVAFPLLVSTAWTGIVAITAWVSEMLLCHSAQALEFGPWAKWAFNRAVHPIWHCTSCLLAWLLVQTILVAHGHDRGWGEAKLQLAYGMVPYVSFSNFLKTV